MNKVDLSVRVSELTGLTIKQSGSAIAALLAAIGDALAAGETVSLHGLGSFRPRPRSPRNGSHPVTREPISLPASVTVSFTPASGLKRRLANAPVPSEGGVESS